MGREHTRRHGADGIPSLQELSLVGRDALPGYNERIFITGRRMERKDGRFIIWENEASSQPRQADTSSWVDSLSYWALCQESHSEDARPTEVGSSLYFPTLLD